MPTPIKFSDLEELNNKIKKARGVLAIVQDGMPTDGMDDIGWALCAAFDYIHDAMNEIDKLVDEAAKK